MPSLFTQILKSFKFTKSGGLRKSEFKTETIKGK